jgi:hypothetical protein
MSVSTNPGATAVTYTAWGASAFAIDWVRLLSPALLAP